jgi:hypothetical protein
MLEQAENTNTPKYDSDIARYEVSEDGVTWRPYDPRRDRDRPLHKRIEFAPPAED